VTAPDPAVDVLGSSAKTAAVGRTPRLHALMIASEVSPWAKTGGLADVAGALPHALGVLGHSVTLVMPRYRGLQDGAEPAAHERIVLGRVAHDITFFTRDISETFRLVTVDAPPLFDREGLYGTSGHDYPDNAERFALLAAAALTYGEATAAERPVDIVHGHDWQAGLAPLLLARHPGRYPALSRAGRVFTIHNLAYQGLFPPEVLPALGLPWDVFTVDTGEFWGRFSYLKAGITASDLVTTVSPTYARETQTPAFGAGMEGVLASRSDRYVGILNGIDTDLWNPATDRLLPAHYDAEHLDGKLVCKRAALERFGLAVGDDALARPLIGMVTRLVEQKGLDLVEEACDALANLEASWVIVGQGDARYETFLTRWASRYPTRVGVRIGFDEELAHLVEAGADIFLMPSRFEPCGLNQMYSLRYGTVPIVHAVGGLEDTIQPYTARALHANGFKFREATAETLVRTVRQAVRLYADTPRWRRLVEEGMSVDHSWRNAAREYGKVYRRARLMAATRAVR
jgi:starch synthase